MPDEAGGCPGGAIHNQPSGGKISADGIAGAPSPAPPGELFPGNAPTASTAQLHRQLSDLRADFIALCPDGEEAGSARWPEILTEAGVGWQYHRCHSVEKLLAALKGLSEQIAEWKGI